MTNRLRSQLDESSGAGQYGRGALWVAQRQAPLPGEGLGELGRRLLAKARAGG